MHGLGTLQLVTTNVFAIRVTTNYCSLYKVKSIMLQLCAKVEQPVEMCLCFTSLIGISMTQLYSILSYTDIWTSV